MVLQFATPGVGVGTGVGYQVFQVFQISQTGVTQGGDVGADSVQGS